MIIKINIYKGTLCPPRCFLFSNHLLVTTRTHAGRLHLVEGVGRISLAEVSLIEDPSDEERIDEGELVIRPSLMYLVVMGVMNEAQ